MSDTILLGVLRMPIDYVCGPLSPMAQLVARAREAADRIEADAAEIARLRAELLHYEQMRDARQRVALAGGPRLEDFSSWPDGEPEISGM